MGAEHSRRSHGRRQRPTSAAMPPAGHHELPTDDQNKSSAAPISTELTHRKKSRQMDRLRRTLSFRSRKKGANANANANNNNLPASPTTSTPTAATVANTKNGNTSGSSADNKPLQWQDDEKSVRIGACSFTVKYLGSVEVQESRGMHVCEQAIQALLNQKGKHMKAVLHISGDALRVVDETNKGLIVDQTIEKVSFCAPDRHHEKGFAYICRDGTTRRWLCHGFLAIKDSGERLSHAVGCAFQICLERKQKRDRECSVTVEYSQNGTSFTRFGSFRTTSITERLIDPQSAIVADPIPSTTLTTSNLPSYQTKPIERPRPKGSDSDAFSRSASLRLGDWNQPTSSAFKRQSSLRPSDLPSIQEARQKTLPTNTIPEEIEPVPSITDLHKLSLIDSTNTNNGHTSSIDSYSFSTNKSLSYVPPPAVVPQPQLPVMTNENLSKNLWLNNTTSFLPEVVEEATENVSKPSLPPSITDALNSNLSALVQSNNPTNPFSPYGYSMAAQAQSPHLNHRQTAIFTPKRGTNPFDDDLIKR